MTETVFLILLSLWDEPRHGYGIIKEVERLSAGRVRFSTGTLYGALARLLEQGAIEPTGEAEDGRGKRSYALTGSGRDLLAAEVRRMETLVSTARAWLGSA